MRGGRLVVAVLAAGTLAVGAGPALAAQSATTTATPAKPAPTAMAKQNAATPKSMETKESKAQQQKETRTAKKGEREKEVRADRIVRGEVTHVDTAAKPRTLTMNVMRGKQVQTVGVDVPATAKITEGKSTKTLADIKAGDRIWMRYDRLSHGLVADQIHILRMHKVAKVEKGKSYAKATPAAAKSEKAAPAASKSGSTK